MSRHLRNAESEVEETHRRPQLRITWCRAARVYTQTNERDSWTRKWPGLFRARVTCFSPPQLVLLHLWNTMSSGWAWGFGNLSESGKCTFAQTCWICRGGFAESLSVTHVLVRVPGEICHLSKWEKTDEGRRILRRKSNTPQPWTAGQATTRTEMLNRYICFDNYL